jgi:hypothetical protein
MNARTGVERNRWNPTTASIGSDWRARSPVRKRFRFFRFFQTVRPFVAHVSNLHPLPTLPTIVGFDLHRFPFDVQKLPFHVSTFERSDQVKFGKDLAAGGRLLPSGTLIPEGSLVPSEFQVWRAVQEDIHETHQKESSSRSTYPMYTVTASVSRKPQYHMFNVFAVVFILTVLSGTGFAIDVTDVGQRMSAILTLILTNVAFKYVISQSIPHVSYNTVAPAGAFVLI